MEVSSSPGGVVYSGLDEVQVALVEAGDRVAEAHGVPGGEAGDDPQDALLAVLTDLTIAVCPLSYRLRYWDDIR